MILSDRDIRNRKQNLVAVNYIPFVIRTALIEPWVEENIQPASVDLTLGNSIEWFVGPMDGGEAIDPRESRKLTSAFLSQGDPFIIYPGMFILASTAETVCIPSDLVGQVSGKSSLARLGLSIHETAGWIDPGFEGQITLEITNKAPLPIKLYPGMKICQISFTQLSSPAQRPYGSEGLGSKYQGQQGPTTSRYFEND